MCSRILKSKSKSMKKWLEDVSNSSPHSGQFKFKKGAVLHKANTNTNTIVTTVNSVPDNKTFASRKKSCVSNDK